MSNFISYDEGTALRKERNLSALLNYKAKHSLEEYSHFMNKNPCDFSMVHTQDSNILSVWCLFTVKSQHVYGDCVEECLDKAMVAGNE